jgi:sugar transferase (PEP-CTERM/EpsH1 system associated)
MKLLVLSSRPPWPPAMADQMTVDRLLRFLVSRGHEADLVCFVEDEAQDRELRCGLSGVCREIETVRLPAWRSYATTAATLPFRRPMQTEYFRSAEMHRVLARRVREGDYELCYTHLIRMAEYSRHLALPKVIGFQVSQALNLERMVAHARDPLRRLFYWVEARKVRPYEARLCSDYDRVFVCGPADVEAIRRSAPAPNLVICPHGQDVPPLERVRGAVREPGAIAVSGVMATYTNVDAVTWFAKEIFPRVEAELPEAAFWIVGRRPQQAVEELARPPRVVVTGEVPDVSDWLCRAQVGVAPLRIAAGMQNKLVQAMACELPVVATSAANEGIRATPGEHLLVRDDAAGIADAVIALLRDAAERERLGRAARRFVEGHWTWEAHFEKLEKVLREVAAT